MREVNAVWVKMVAREGSRKVMTGAASRRRTGTGICDNNVIYLPSTGGDRYSPLKDVRIAGKATRAT